MTFLKHVMPKHGNVNFRYDFRLKFTPWFSYSRKQMRDLKQNVSSWSVNSFDFALEKLRWRWSARAIFHAQNRTNKQTNKTCFTAYTYPYALVVTEKVMRLNCHFLLLCFPHCDTHICGTYPAKIWDNVVLDVLEEMIKLINLFYFGFVLCH